MTVGVRYNDSRKSLEFLFHASHTCRCLIHAGVDPTAATVSGDTALHAAAQEGHSQVMAYLLHLGLQVVITFHTIMNIKYWSVKAQSTLRVVMATFWRTFHHDGKISPA
jgi:ankyrin repeat protein